MNCKECQSLIEEYVDGELDQAAAESIASHLGSCDACALAGNELMQESLIYGQYARNLDSSDALWSGVQTRLQARQPGFNLHRRQSARGMLSLLFGAPRISLPATIAMVLVAIVITGVIVKRTAPEPERNIAVSVGTVPPQMSAPLGDEQRNATSKGAIAAGLPPDKQEHRTRVTARNSATGIATARHREEPHPDQLVHEAQKKYLTAIGLLSRDLYRTHSKLDPETRAKLEQALASVDRAIESTRRAVRQHPDDPVAVQYMLAAYAKKVDLLREAASRNAF